MFDKGIYLYQVLLLEGNIIVAKPDKSQILFRLKPFNKTSINTYITDTIGELCTGNVTSYTTPKERAQFLKWFDININNLKELHV